ncbi:MAG TPA: hypothetical protein VF257_17140 [Solirubrobacteraceae bacterium]
MKLLEAEPVAAPEVAPDPPRETPPEHAPGQPEAVPTCASCGAPMQDGQDWCLTCGAAAPGSLGQRPGWRAASTVIALTVVLVLGAIGASYAALTGNDKQPSTPAPAPAQAQVTPPPTTPPTPTPPAATQTTPTTPTTPSQPSTPTTKLPKVTTPKTPAAGGSPIIPSTPKTTTPKTTTPSTPATPTGTPTTTSPQPTDTGPQPIELAGDAGTTYDPYGRAKASGETERAIDGDKATSWFVEAKDPQQVGVGYAVNLGKLQGIREIELETSTPGFRIEVYATDETELPPDILDTRWSHITNVSDVGKKDAGKQKIVLGAGTTKYRNLLLWFTKPPTDGARLRLTELQLLG